jgi:hypothetical protein
VPLVEKKGRNQERKKKDQKGEKESVYARNGENKGQRKEKKGPSQRKCRRRMAAAHPPHQVESKQSDKSKGIHYSISSIPFLPQSE